MSEKDIKTKEELKKYFETGDKPTQEQYAELIDSYVHLKQETGEADRRFVIDADGKVSIVSEKQESEYTLSDIVGNKLSLLKNGQVVKEVDLTSYIDDTNLSRLVSGTVASNGIATFKRDDNSTFTVDFSGLSQENTPLSLDNLTDAQSNTNSVLIGTKETPDSVGETRGVNNVVVGKDTILDGVGNDNVLIGKSVLGGLGGNRNNNSNNNVVIGSKAAEDRIFFNDNVVIGSNSVTTDGSGNRNIVVGSNIEIGGHGVNDQLNIGNAIKGDLSTKVIELEKLKLSQLENGNIASDKLLGIDSSGNVKKIDSGNTGLPANFYEEGDWKPQISKGITIGTIGSSVAKYVRNGNMVHFSIQLNEIITANVGGNHNISLPQSIPAVGLGLINVNFVSAGANSGSIFSPEDLKLEAKCTTSDKIWFNDKRGRNYNIVFKPPGSVLIVSGVYMTNVYKP